MKNKFDELDSDFVEEITHSDNDKINSIISTIAKNQEELMQAKEDDLDLQNLKEQVKVANEPYAQGTKANRLKIRFACQTLKDRGTV